MKSGDWFWLKFLYSRFSTDFCSSVGTTGTTAEVAAMTGMKNTIVTNATTATIVQDLGLSRQVSLLLLLKGQEIGSFE